MEIRCWMIDCYPRSIQSPTIGDCENIGRDGLMYSHDDPATRFASRADAESVLSEFGDRYPEYRCRVNAKIY